MREIKFRGKRVDNGEWLYGNLLDLVTNEMEALPAIRTFCQVPCPYDYMQPVLGSEDFVVDENTVGQYTGLKDKNGTEIFEGDIVEVKIHNWAKKDDVLASGNEIVEFHNGKFGVFWGYRREFKTFDNFCETTFEIIGNIYDNPELLEATK